MPLSSKITFIMQIKPLVLKQIRTNNELVRKLEDCFNKKPYTMQEWLRTNLRSLTEYGSLMIISNYLNTDIIDLIEPRSKENIAK